MELIYATTNISIGKIHWYSIATSIQIFYVPWHCFRSQPKVSQGSENKWNHDRGNHVMHNIEKVRSAGVGFIIFILCLMLMSPSLFAMTCILYKEVNQLVNDEEKIIFLHINSQGSI